MKNRIIFGLLVAVCCFSINTNAYAITAAAEKTEQLSATVNVTDISEDEADVIKKFSFRDKLQRSPQAQIKSFYKDFNKYSEKSDIEKLKNLYADSYMNNDGFDKKTIFIMMDKAKDAYKDVQYTTTLDKIVVNGNYATVDIHEIAIGTTTKKQEEINDYGLVSSDIYSTDYLKKEGNKWKIVSSEIKSEKVSLKYGETKNMPIELIAPEAVGAGSEYDVKVITKSPDGVLVIGSIVNEPVTYPQAQKKDVFKSVKKEVIERVLTANKDNKNEYAAVTIGVTRASIEPPRVVFDMTGMAFVMSRVNVYHKNECLNKDKESTDAK